MDRQASGLHNKVIIVSGVDRGLSRESALFFAENGARLVLCASAPGRMLDGPARSFAFEIAELGGEALIAAETGFTNVGAARIVEQALDTFGRVDVLLNVNPPAAGSPPVRPARDERSPDATAPRAAFNHLAMAVGSHFVKQQVGSFIHSVAVETILPGAREYVAAKMEVMRFSALVARELRKHDIRSNCVFPSDASPLLLRARAQDTGGNIVSIQEKAELKSMVRLCGLLASEAAKNVTGEVFEVAGREITLLRDQTSMAFARSGCSSQDPLEEGWTLFPSSSEELRSILQGSLHGPAPEANRGGSSLLESKRRM